MKGTTKEMQFIRRHKEKDHTSEGTHPRQRRKLVDRGVKAAIYVARDPFWGGFPHLNWCDRNNKCFWWGYYKWLVLHLIHLNTVFIWISVHSRDPTVPELQVSTNYKRAPTHYNGRSTSKITTLLKDQPLECSNHVLELKKPYGLKGEATPVKPGWT